MSEIHSTGKISSGTRLANERRGHNWNKRVMTVKDKMTEGLKCAFHFYSEVIWSFEDITNPVGNGTSSLVY